MSHVQLVEQYYDAIDDGDGEALTAVLTPEFCHDRPDRTLGGRDRFVAFMLEERPRTDTVHAVETVFSPADDTDAVAVHGRLFADDGSELFAFVDLFTIDGDRISHLQTFTR
jgi:ketosteroid isomerase-like protein